MASDHPIEISTFDPTAMSNNLTVYFGRCRIKRQNGYVSQQHCKPSLA